MGGSPDFPPLQSPRSLPSPCVSIADFNALRSRRHDEELRLYAFDVLGLDGEDLRGLPLSMRKTNLAQLLRGRPDGIVVAPFEQGEIGPDLFRAACNMGLEGMVSKRADRLLAQHAISDSLTEAVILLTYPATDRVLVEALKPLVQCADEELRCRRKIRRSHRNSSWRRQFGKLHCRLARSP